jgi:RimJ/RimL family protein N-acetyltransferase
LVHTRILSFCQAFRLAYNRGVAEIVARKPRNCSPAELAAFTALGAKGWQGRSEKLPKRIRRARALIFLCEGETLTGVAALKRPGSHYRRKLFERAGTSEDPDDYRLEAGLIYIEPGYRGQGHSTRMLAEMLRLAGDERVFATTRADNPIIQRSLRRCGLQQTGQAFASEGGDHRLRLYITPLSNKKSPSM